MPKLDISQNKTPKKNIWHSKVTLLLLLSYIFTCLHNGVDMTDDSKSPQIASTFLSVLANPSTDNHNPFLNLQFPSSFIFIHVGMVHSQAFLWI